MKAGSREQNEKNENQIFDQEQRSKVLKEALLFLLLACWEHEQKCCKPNKNCAKNVPTSQNEVHKGSKGANFYILWHFMTLNCHVFLVWPFVAMYGHAVAFQGHRHVWPHSTKHVLCDLVWACMALYGLAWRCMAFLWSHMIFYGRILSFLAVIDPNLFGLVLIKMRVSFKTRKKIGSFNILQAEQNGK